MTHLRIGSEHIPAMTQTQQADDHLIDTLAEHGYTVVEDFLHPALVMALASEAQTLQQTGELKPASIGRQHTAQLDTSLRGDAIQWLDEASATPTQKTYLERMHSLREQFNRQFYLNLVELETHFAVYPPGGGYTRHLDQFQASGARKISSILYLNHAWQAEHGGQLRLYLDGENLTPYLDIEPVGGRLVLFDSSRFYHEVLPATRERISLTGWFRTRPENPLT